MSATAPAPDQGLAVEGGLTGFALDVVDRTGELGIGLLVVLETVFPPVPSEVILPLGGYLAAQQRLDLVLVVLAATLGSLAGSWLLYALGARLGRVRVTTALGRLPLMDDGDVDRAFVWFDRHGGKAVLLGRLVPGVRSLVSLPAGAAGMSPLGFSLLTVLGSTAWNALLIAGGYALGTRYHLVERYAGVLDAVLLTGLGAALALLVARRVQRSRRTTS